MDTLNYFALEDPVSLVRLEQTLTALEELEGLVVIDEVQLRPDLIFHISITGVRWSDCQLNILIVVVNTMIYQE
jgi:hypothetical protein